MDQVVRLSDGKDTVRAYVSKQASLGLAHVLELVSNDNRRVVGLIADLTDEDGSRVTPADEWAAFDVMRHMSASLDRSKSRLETLSSGTPWESPAPVLPGNMGAANYASFHELRSAYIDGMADIIAVLRHADGSNGLGLTVEHAQYGPFNWLEWSVYSHHVHTHDHIGQLTKIVEALRQA
jgi:hypothetical protein